LRALFAGFDLAAALAGDFADDLAGAFAGFAAAFDAAFDVGLPAVFDVVFVACFGAVLVADLVLALDAVSDAGAADFFAEVTAGRLPLVAEADLAVVEDFSFRGAFTAFAVFLSDLLSVASVTVFDVFAGLDAFSAAAAFSPFGALAAFAAFPALPDRAASVAAASGGLVDSGARVALGAPAASGARAAGADLLLVGDPTGGAGGCLGWGGFRLRAASSASRISFSPSSGDICPRLTMYCTRSRALSTAKPARPAAALITSRSAPPILFPASWEISWARAVISATASRMSVPR